MVVNFRACEISWGARKLTQTPTLIIIIKNLEVWIQYIFEEANTATNWLTNHVLTRNPINKDY